MKTLEEFNEIRTSIANEERELILISRNITSIETVQNTHYALMLISTLEKNKFMIKIIDASKEDINKYIEKIYEEAASSGLIRIPYDIYSKSEELYYVGPNE